MTHMLLTDEDAIKALLQRHHKATALKNVDALRYVFAANGIFVGTDDTEQWSSETYTQKLAGTKSGWDMTKWLERHIYAVPGHQNVASFFEIVRHADYGLMRGAGTVVNEEGHWKIVSYVLSFSVPNKAVDTTNLLELLVQDA